MYKISDWRQSTDDVISSVSLVRNVGLISSIGYKFESSDVLS